MSDPARGGRLAGSARADRPASAARVVRIASDWHLGPHSPASHGRLALAFLEAALADGAEVILNGDVFDDLFAGPAALRAHPDVVDAMNGLAARGLLRRTAGNHDPDLPLQRVELEVAGLGRVLVAHGHAVDPVNASPIGRLGDGISRRFGRFAVVRGAAWLAEAATRALAGRAMVRIFRERCLAVVVREGYSLGVFGHVHVAHLEIGDRYANAGAMGERLEYLELAPGGPRLASLGPEDAEGSTLRRLRG